MKVSADLCVVPIGAGVSLSSYIAKCQQVLETFPLTVSMHASGTSIQGDWDSVMAAVQACHEALHSMGVVQLGSALKLETRTDRHQSLEDKISSVKRQISSG